jgi:hopanoid biosynthesis associated RND transporter like protein HpnN
LTELFCRIAIESVKPWNLELRKVAGAAMLNSAIIRIVGFCARYRWTVIVAGIVVMIATGVFAVTRFSITTDVESLISENLPWHQRQLELSNAFPQQGITAVVTAPTAENADQSAERLAQALSKNPSLYPIIAQPDSGDFFNRNGLLFEPLSQVKSSMDGLKTAEPILSVLAADPSLRGVMKAISFATEGVEAGQIKLDQLVWPLSLAEKTLGDLLAGKPATFSWRELLQGHPSPGVQLRHFLEVQPKLDFAALQPGRAATDGIRQAADDLKLAEKFGAKVDLTGQVPLNDDQFSVIQQSAPRDTLIAIFGVLVILWLALRSWKIIVAVFFSLIVGLAATAALGLVVVGSFNLISIAFFVLFVGLGVDFGIQFSVRYRSERHAHDNVRDALLCSARKAGDPLALAGAATAVGFFSFLPTSYRGLSELGLIAGFGMLIAFFCSITLVPAMIAALNPPGEPESIGFKSLAPLDHFLQRHRIAVIAGTLLVVLAGTPLLAHLRFDFNPIDLQNPDSASVKLYRELQREPQTSGNDAELLAASLGDADSKARTLASLPEVSRVLTLSSFIPADQDQKIAAIKEASQALGTALHPAKQQPAPTDQEQIAAIRGAAQNLSEVAGNATGAGADAARRVSDLLKRLADADVSTRDKAEVALVPPLNYDLDLLRESLDPQMVTTATLPSSLVRDWVLPDGRARVQAQPKGAPNDTNVLRTFAVAVLRAEPSATGPAISYYESEKTVIYAFVEAALFALCAIAILLLIVLRRVTDVLLTLIPLLLAGAVTLEVCALSGFALNFANIIALPLLLGVGVAFKIYYIMAWRAGQTNLLQSTLTRAVTFSAMTNAVAFGSMWASNYPGMSSMGKMMALALLCTMAAAVLFQPVLMGPPRQVSADSPEAPPRLRVAAE